MNLTERIAKYGFKATMKKMKVNTYQIKTNPPLYYTNLAIMLHNDGYEVSTDVANETIIAKEKV